LSNLVDYEFTAEMEDFLDEISRHETGHVDYLHKFFFGNDTPGLRRRVESKSKEIDAREAGKFSLGIPASGEHREEVFVRVGKFGPYVEQGARRASVPEELPPDELTLQRALELLDKGRQDDEPLGYCPQTGKPVYLKSGRFGPYVQLGSATDNEKPKNASLLKGMAPEEVDVPTALRLLSLPRTLGEHPETKLPVIAQNGRYGPFVKCGDETRSLPEGLSPLDVSLEQALALLAQPKTRGVRGGKSREPLRVFENSPLTQQPVRILDGRYGPYVTDGQTNASLPKDVQPGEATFEFALQLLAARAEQNAASPKKKKPAGKKK
jgi:DNA topoisomerase-1